MKQYLDLLKDVLENGVERKDRTGVGTKSVFGRQIRFNLQEGFPLLTTKKMPFKSIASELLWFLEGSTDERRLAEILYGKPRKDLQDKKTIWTANAEDPNWRSRASYEGDLGRVYGASWRRWDNYKFWEDHVVEIKVESEQGINEDYVLNFDYVHPIYNEHSDDFVGTTFKSLSGDECLVIERLPKTKNGNSNYKIQFINTTQNFIKTVCRPNLRSGQFTNPYKINESNRGVLGIVDKKRKDYKKAQELWYNMMCRCHGNDLSGQYKDKGIFVDKYWRCFENFYRDIVNLPGYKEWLLNPSLYNIDKDYFGRGYYGRTSCIFLPERYNQYMLPSSNGGLILATNKKTGEIFKFTSPGLFLKKYKIKDKDIVNRAFRESNGNTRNWSFEKIPPRKGHVFRQQFFVDQISDVIKSLKQDPYSRRHLVVTYNPGELDLVSLPPCHVMFQFYVNDDNELSCMWTQRSVDVPLGLPFNIASYALLTHMVAQVCGFKVGELIGSLGDCHVYLNQVDAVKIQLGRTPRPLSLLVLNKDIDDIFKFTLDDMAVVNYNPHDKLEISFSV